MSTAEPAASVSRILDTDELIGLAEVRRLLGNPSISTVYDDPELMELKISMSAPMPTGDWRGRRITWIKREILALRARRVEVATEEAVDEKRRAEHRRRMRRERQQRAESRRQRETTTRQSV